MFQKWKTSANASPAGWRERVRQRRGAVLVSGVLLPCLLAAWALGKRSFSQNEGHQSSHDTTYCANIPRPRAPFSLQTPLQTSSTVLCPDLRRPLVQPSVFPFGKAFQIPGVGLGCSRGLADCVYVMTTEGEYCLHFPTFMSDSSASSVGLSSEPYPKATYWQPLDTSCHHLLPV